MCIDLEYPKFSRMKRSLKFQIEHCLIVSELYIFFLVYSSQHITNLAKNSIVFVFKLIKNSKIARPILFTNHEDEK
jgi:hypothetical protein